MQSSAVHSKHSSTTLTHQQMQQRQRFYRNDSTVLVTTIITYHCKKNFFFNIYITKNKTKCPCSACPSPAVPVPHVPVPRVPSPAICILLTCSSSSSDGGCCRSVGSGVTRIVDSKLEFRSTKRSYAVRLSSIHHLKFANVNTGDRSVQRIGPTVLQQAN